MSTKSIKKKKTDIFYKMMIVVIVVFIILGEMLIRHRPGLFPFIIETFFLIIGFFILIGLVVVLFRAVLTSKNIGDKLFFLALGLLFSFGLIFNFEGIKTNLLDIPYIGKNEYLQCTGICTNKKIIDAFRDRYYKFTINNIKFSINEDYESKIIEGKTYTVTYLPNSKYIINIQDEDKILLGENNGKFIIGINAVTRIIYVSLLVGSTILVLIVYYYREKKSPRAKKESKKSIWNLYNR